MSNHMKLNQEKTKTTPLQHLPYHLPLKAMKPPAKTQNKNHHNMLKS